MRIIAVVVASLALAGGVNAQEQTGTWKAQYGVVVTPGSDPLMWWPGLKPGILVSSSLEVGCFLGSVHAEIQWPMHIFPNGSAVLTWDGREEQYTFEGLESLGYPAIILRTEELSFIENLISHNRLTVKAEMETHADENGQRDRSPLDTTFDLSGSQTALSTLSCSWTSSRPMPSWWPSQPAPRALAGAWNPPTGALERARQKCRETFSDDFVLQNACIEQQEEGVQESAMKFH